MVLNRFVLVGLGLANVFPPAIARAGAAGGSSGVTLASTVGCTGLLGGPPVIGLLVGALGLPAALASVSVLAAGRRCTAGRATSPCSSRPPAPSRTGR